MAKLTNQDKELIVNSLACNIDTSEVIKLVKQETGKELTRHQIYHYHPEKGNTGNTGKVGKKWVEMFWERRKKWLESMEDVEHSYKAVRVRTLNKMLKKLEGKFDEALEKGNYVVYNEAAKQIRDTLEQIAKEVNNVYRPASISVTQNNQFNNTENHYYEDITRRIEEANEL